jgi:DegV family protein with EDD domain
MGQGFMAIAAGEALQEGATIEDAVAAALNIAERAHVYGALSTLKYLSMSGRVSHLAAGMAGMLNIKPILAMQNGKLDLLEKVRTQKKAWARIIELVKRDVDSREIERMAILHVAAREDAEQFKKILQKNVSCPQDIPFVQLTPGLSIHTGAGLVGVAFVTKE